MDTIDEYMKKQAEIVDYPLNKQAATVSNIVGSTIGAGLGLTAGKMIGGTLERLKDTTSSSALDIIQATEVEEELKDILERIYKRRSERGVVNEKHRTIRL